MQYRIRILRRKNGAEHPYWQTFRYDAELENATVATALSKLNERSPLLDEEGQEAPKILWDCSCLQKKCGACAMIINGRPGLACDRKLADLPQEIVLEPLRKFPCVADLVCDRTVLYENLAAMQSWLRSETLASEQQNETLYEASRCLQCGCCLEICPNFYAGGEFYGMASMVPVARLLEEMTGAERQELRRSYREHVFEGCGKSLACREICPAGIDMERLLSNSNGVALWRALFRRK